MLPTKELISDKKKVFVGLSGGVDSAVSAALLKEQGFDVTGVFIKVWQPDFLPCTWREDRRDAMRVCARLGIPFLFFDFTHEYKKGVADYMIEEYKKGKTPNPDVLCNREIKFGAFWKEAKKRGADFIATGHYARVEKGELLEGKDKNKDQSYFLWMITKEDLEHIIFPIGHLEKGEVRKLAKKFDLPTAEKKDSQGICFLGDVDIEEFLSHFVEFKPGSVLNTEGQEIGRHNGALLYTIGERHGFTIDSKTPLTKPFFIIGKDMGQNTITVSDNRLLIEERLPKEASLDKVNWINSPSGEIFARIRYRQEKFPIKIDGETVIFSKPQTSASGQSIVFYEGERCLGGAILS